MTVYGLLKHMLGLLHSPRRAPAAREAAAVQEEEARVLEALSRLAGGVAHDLNNILLVVQGYTDMALAEEDVGFEVRSLITEVREATMRAAGMVQDLLTAGQRGPFHPQFVDLNDAVQRQLPVIGAAFGDAMRITASFGDGLPPVLLDEDLLGRLLMALCARAKDAMPAGGDVTVETTSDGGPAGVDRVLLRVSDTGETVPDEARGRLFEPYLPGRDGCKGPGLGPLIVHSVARRLGGEVVMERTDGGGTTFAVSLPACAPGTASRSPETASWSAPVVDPPAASPPHATVLQPTETAPQSLETARKSSGTAPRSAAVLGTILIAEDDDGLRALAVKILSWEGYTVIAARDGQEAMEIFERDSGGISLVLLDDVMPRMGGRAALERIRHTAPDLPAILCSGYTWRLDGTLGECDAFCAILQKPWQPRELLYRVRESLRVNR